jgi:kynurenine formamidase
MSQLRRGIALWVILLATALAGFGQQRARGSAINSQKLLDLTYDFDQNTVYWPSAHPFHWDREHWGPTAGGYFYAAGRYEASEHGGTHIDAPVHFAEGKATLDQIPLARLVAPAVVIDISRQCAADTDYRLAVADIAAFEKVHGRVPAGSIVLVRTGWGKYWPDRKKYLGSDVPGDTQHLHFPGISAEAAKMLVEERKIAGVGIDTASMDYGPSKDFLAHRIINGANAYGLENVANLERVPATGATILALPMKIKGGSGGPTRIVVLLP